MAISTDPATRNCLKCQHVNQQATMAEDEACPQCGGIYSRIEAYLRAEQARGGPSVRANIAPAAPLVPPVPPAGRLIDPEFVAAMRAQSLYPTFRQLVKLVAWLFYLVAIALVVAGFQVGSAAATVGAFSGAVVLAVVATAVKEAALMMADLSDATVIHTARNFNEN